MRLSDLKLSKGLVVDLVLRRVLLDGHSSLTELSESLKLSLPIVDSVFRELRSQQLIDVKGMTGDDYNFTLTTAGRTLAGERFSVVQYAGPAPVSLDQYHVATLAQAAKIKLNRSQLREALSDLVLTEGLLSKLGPALISQDSLFIYGPSGNGKTSLAERLLRVYGDYIIIPYAVEVDGQIIILYDPVVHRKIEADDPDLDPRWVVCKRPCITVGGELVSAMLELKLDEGSGVYAAPLQMKANNGIFLVDDFGRQCMTPAELLNRWIIPMDRRVDYLTLRYGVKFQIPFQLMVVFSTNLDPSDLMDKAFLRRIQNKIYLSAVSAATFDEIFRRVIAERELPCDPDAGAHLRGLCRSYGEELRACHPADICKIVVSINEFEEQPVRITKAELERAAQLYFAGSDPDNGSPDKPRSPVVLNKPL